MELNPILQQINSLKQEAEKLQPVKPELERVFWDKFRLEFNYNSNHMEGNTLTYGHTQILLKSGDVVGKYNFRELQEMKAHDLAVKIIRESAFDPEFPLNQKFIKEINQIILVEPYYNDAITQEGNPTQKLITPGEYKKTPNSVRLKSGEMFYYPTPEETPALMGELIDWYKKETNSNELHPVQIAALFHYKLVRIHPFDDSNGRTSRLLMNYILLKYGYAPLVIESKDKKNYLIALNEADAGDMEAFVKYITNLALRWQGLYVKALKGEKIEETDDFEKEVELLKKDLKKIEKKIDIPEIFKKSFLPLINAIENRLTKLDDFFFKNSLNKTMRDVNGNDYDVNRLNEYKDISQFDGLIISFTYNHIDLKTKGNNINYQSIIHIQFNRDAYQVIVNPANKTITKSYKQLLSKEEIEEISGIVAKTELSFIKSNS